MWILLVFLSILLVLAAIFFYIWSFANDISNKKPALFLFLSSLIPLSIDLILWGLGLIAIDVRFNPSSNDSSYNISCNDSITLASDFSLPFVSPIYYTINGSHVSDSEELIKYSGPIYIRNLNVDNQLTIHAGLNLFGTNLCVADSVYTYNINRQKAKIHINVENVEVSLSDLKNQNYIVPLYIDIEENSGVDYFACTFYIDDRCTYKMGRSQKPRIMLNDLTHFTEGNYMFLQYWRSYYETTPSEETGTLLMLNVTIPSDCKVGDYFTVDYTTDYNRLSYIKENDSYEERGHIWYNGDNELTENGEVTWQNGGIFITE